MTSLLLLAIRLSTQASKFLLTLFLARYMAFEALGVYGLVVSASIMAPPILGAGLMYNLSREAVLKSLADTLAELHNYRQFILSIYLLILAGSALYGVWQGNLLFVALVLSVVFLEHINTDLYNLWVNLSKPLLANLLHFFRGGLWIILYMILAFFVEKLRTIEAVFVFWILGNLLSLVVALFELRRLRQQIQPRAMPFFAWLKARIRLTKNVYALHFLITLGSYTDRYIISILLGLELTGIYVFFWSINSAICNLVRAAVIHVAQPEIIKSANSGTDSLQQSYRHCLRKAMLYTFVLSVAVWSFVFLILPVLEKPEIQHWFNFAFLYFVVSLLMMTSEANQLVFYSQYREDLMVLQYLSYFVISTALNFVLVPFISLWGAGAAMIVSFILLIALQRRYAKRHLGFSLSN